MAWTVAQVDGFVDADKTLVGDAGWVCDPNEDQCRLRFTIAVAGVPTSSTFEVIDFPLNDPRGWTFTLNLPPCVWRLDYIPWSQFHTNEVPDGHECPKLVRGPHFHPWRLNRQFHKGNVPPDRLPLALPLPSGIKSFKSSLDWFCAEVRITIAKHQLPELPPARRLL
jgi:hypothetical protein